MNLHGIMQERLPPPVDGKIQAFPLAHWAEEFPSAAEIGLGSIEWILETPLDTNPLWSDEGLSQIRDQICKTGVRVDLVCASPFIRMSPDDLKRNQSAVARHYKEQLVSWLSESGF